MNDLPHFGHRFDTTRPLSTGGMAGTWLAEDRETGVTVVVKALGETATETEIALLERELEIGRQLNHPHIVEIFELHRAGGRAFLTMEYIEGGDAGTLRGRPPSEIVPVVRQVAEALAYAHRQGIVHRDVKLSNVLLDGSGRAHLADFGIAGGPGTGPAEPRLSGGGSRNNASPQQLEGLDPRPSDDVYALGAMIHELVTGYPPLRPEPTDDRGHPTSCDEMRSSWPIPDQLRSLVVAMLALSPDHRPPMETVVQTLRALQDEATPDRTESGPKIPKRRVRLTAPPRVDRIRAATPVKVSRPVAAGPGRTRRWVVASITVALGAALLGVFVVLPRWVDQRRTPTVEMDSVDVPRVPDAVVTTRPSAGFDRATQALDRATRRRKTIEGRGAERWGGQDYSTAVELIAAGDTQLKEGNTDGAAVAYDEAADLLEAVHAAMPEILSGAIAAGDRALAAGDAPGAIEAYHIALSVAPGHPGATQGLRRAEVLDQVTELLDRGRDIQRTGDLPGAADHYRRAAVLDPRSSEARAALAEVSKRIEGDAFTIAMSEGLDALDRTEFGLARQAFQRAAALRPGSPESADGVARADEGLRLQKIEHHRRQAEILEDEERWGAALDVYEALLATDPTLAFAQDGRARAIHRARLAERIEYHLAHGDRLATIAVLEEASELLDEAREVAPAGPVLEEQIVRLERLNRLAATPVNVELESDSYTEVVIHQVGKLGTFTRRSLELRPGVYTVVGTRQGFRDVRLELTVRPGQTSEPLVVRCEEEI
jgi:tetratricopeptide (TPR) repeat protein